MTTRYRTRGIVFKKINRNESDKIFSVFTDDFGRLDIFAKAIRKSVSKLRSGIDLFFLSDIEFIQGKNKKTLTDAILIEKFDNICQDPEKMKVAHDLGIILDNFIKGEEKDKGIFNLLSETFFRLNSRDLDSKKYNLAYYYFSWNAISLLGYRPEVQKCNICQEKLNPYNIYFSNKEGGVVCKNCVSLKTDNKKINSDIVKIIRLILNKEWQTLVKLKIEPSSKELFEEVSNGYYSYTLSGHSSK